MRGTEQLGPKIQWFYGDSAKRDTRPKISAKDAANHKKPITWTPFTDYDSDRIELIFQAFHMKQSKIKLVPCNEDHLYEANVETQELYSVYWRGPVYAIRRGCWFWAPDRKNFVPCDENLSQQVESGYSKFRPWNTSAPPPLTDAIPTSFSSNPLEQQQIQDKPEFRWALFGPYSNKYVLYQSAVVAYMMSDDISDKLARALRISDGIKLIRGWDEVIKLNSKTPAPTPIAGTSGIKKLVESDVKTRSLLEPVEKSDASLIREVPRMSLSNESLAESVCENESVIDYSDREIRHLFLVVHGIGQKMAEHTIGNDLIDDCNVLRGMFKSTSREMKQLLPELPISMPLDGGVQVLPILWRANLEIGAQLPTESQVPDPVICKDQSPTTSPKKTIVNKEAVEPPEPRHISLSDITLEGVPAIRTICNDVIVDVLLYMTPKYRQTMVSNVTSEANRLYRLYAKRNPSFKGKVHIYAHSLGSLISFDILCNQESPKAGKQNLSNQQQVKMVPNGEGVDLGDILNFPSDSSRKAGGINSSLNDSVVEYESFDFAVESLFCVGSPVGLFLMLRGDQIRARIPGSDSKETGIVRPCVNQLYNIFHPFDPVAYRMEPMLKASFAGTKPQLMHYTKGGLTSRVNQINSGINSGFSAGFSMFESVRMGIVKSGQTVVNAVGSFASRTDPTPAAEVVGDVDMKDIDPSKVLEDDNIFLLNAHGRLDYILQEGVLDQPYLAALAVHVNYWSDMDVAVFILKELYTR